MNIIADCAGKSRIRYGFSGTMKGREGAAPGKRGFLGRWKGLPVLEEAGSSPLECTDIHTI